MTVFLSSLIVGYVLTHFYYHPQQVKKGLLYLASKIKDENKDNPV